MSLQPLVPSITLQFAPLPRPDHLCHLWNHCSALCQLLHLLLLTGNWIIPMNSAAPVCPETQPRQPRSTALSAAVGNWGKRFMSLVFCSIKLSLGVLKLWAKCKHILVIILHLSLATYFQYCHYYTGKYFPFKYAIYLFFLRKKKSFHYILKSEFSLQRNPSPI